MADKKISALTSATTPLAGTEVLPIVQSGTTVKVSVGDLTAGRTVEASQMAIGTSSPTAGSKIHVYGASPRPIVEGSGNGNYATWRYISKTSGGATVNFEQGAGIAADNAFELYDNQNAQLVSRYISGGSGYWSWLTNGTERMRVTAAGDLTVGTTSPGTGTIVDIQSTTKGVRFPNMTTTQKNAITPAAGTVVFDTTLAKLCLYTGAAWQTITSV